MLARLKAFFIYTHTHTYIDRRTFVFYLLYILKTNYNFVIGIDKRKKVIRFSIENNKNTYKLHIRHYSILYECILNT